MIIGKKNSLDQRQSAQTTNLAFKLHKFYWSLNSVWFLGVLDSTEFASAVNEFPSKYPYNMSEVYVDKIIYLQVRHFYKKLYFNPGFVSEPNDQVGKLLD